jgi:acid phosphatase
LNAATARSGNTDRPRSLENPSGRFAGFGHTNLASPLLAAPLAERETKSMRHTFWIALLMLGCFATASAATPSSKHLVVVVEENHSFDTVITQGGMPYLKSLAEKHTLLINYYANHHPSIGNYFTMTTGQTISTDDGYGGVVQDENIVTQLVAANKTWKMYGDSLPRPGYVGGNRRPYVKKHFPMAYFANVRDDEKQRMNLVPVEQFEQDLKSSQGLPEFSMVIPDMDHDAHDGTLKEADDWLRQYIAPLLENPDFQKDGVLIITFDEAAKSDSNHGGGHITTVVIGPLAKEKFADNTFYQHQSLLATIEDLLGLPRLKLVEKVPSFTNAFK